MYLFVYLTENTSLLPWTHRCCPRGMRNGRRWVGMRMNQLLEVGGDSGGLRDNSGPLRPHSRERAGAEPPSCCPIAAPHCPAAPHHSKYFYWLKTQKDSWLGHVLPKPCKSTHHSDQGKHKIIMNVLMSCWVVSLTANKALNWASGSVCKAENAKGRCFSAPVPECPPGPGRAKGEAGASTHGQAGSPPGTQSLPPLPTTLLFRPVQ